MSLKIKNYESLLILLILFVLDILKLFLVDVLFLFLIILVISLEAFFHLSCDSIADQVPSLEGFSMILCDCLFYAAIIFVVNVSESLEPFSLPVPGHSNVFDNSASFKLLLDLLFGNFVRQILHK